MVGKLIIRGLVVGILAGLLAFGYARTYGEPAVDIAVQLEGTHAAAEHAEMMAQGKMPEAEEPDMFGRDIQAGVGLLTGIAGLGAGIGGIFAVLFALAYGRFGSLGPKATAGVLGLMGLVTAYVVPALKYPANPPTVGLEGTIKSRTAFYFLMIGLSVLATVIGLLARKKLIPKFGDWNASVIAGAIYLVVLIVIFTALPTFSEVPGDFPAPTLYNFRIASLGIQTILWGAVSILFGYFNGLPKKA